jgi:hypothetical protein
MATQIQKQCEFQPMQLSSLALSSVAKFGLVQFIFLELLVVISTIARQGRVSAVPMQFGDAVIQPGLSPIADLIVLSIMAGMLVAVLSGSLWFGLWVWMRVAPLTIRVRMYRPGARQSALL